MELSFAQVSTLKRTVDTLMEKNSSPPKMKQPPKKKAKLPRDLSVS